MGGRAARPTLMAGCEAYMAELKNAYKIVVNKPEAKGLL
jgi:hypothetical protein